MRELNCSKWKIAQYSVNLAYRWEYVCWRRVSFLWWWVISFGSCWFFTIRVNAFFFWIARRSDTLKRFESSADLLVTCSFFLRMVISYLIRLQTLLEKFEKGHTCVDTLRFLSQLMKKRHTGIFWWISIRTYKRFSRASLIAEYPCILPCSTRI